METGEIVPVPLQSVGVFAHRCSPKADRLREDISEAIAAEWVTLPEEGSDG